MAKDKYLINIVVQPGYNVVNRTNIRTGEQDQLALIAFYKYLKKIGNTEDYLNVFLRKPSTYSAVECKPVAVSMGSSDYIYYVDPQYVRY